jgi:hypothetical protein
MLAQLFFMLGLNSADSVNLLGELLARRDSTPKPDERPHDIDVHANRPFATEHAR